MDGAFDPEEIAATDLTRAAAAWGSE